MLHYTMHMLEHNFAHVFEKSARMFGVYHRVHQNMAFEYCFDHALIESVFGAHMYDLPRTDSFRFSSHAIHAINDCLLPIDNRGHLIRLCYSNDSINSSHRCSHALYSSRVLSRITCSIKSRSMLLLALSN